ncbi:RNA polymerase sigma factor [Cryptosporangium phraense]|uniref:RNA polymerase sigma factor n=1 Tax=Cryptosporangium phraense TaxID=2593070 RepID=UPI00197AEADB|nr:sigma factor [Cryptosporangium phraense]
MERLQREQFRAFYADAYAPVLRFVQRRVPASQAEDIVADAFLIAWRRFDDAPPQADDRRAWLFGVARNCLLNVNRGQEPRSSASPRPPIACDYSVPDARSAGTSTPLR